MAHAPAGLPPGSVIGILGGGQLGRMIALAAAGLGYRCHVYCPEGDAPAVEVAAHATRAGYGDRAALAAFARAADAVTLEFENVPVEAVERIAATTPVRPDARALAVAQDRVAEKAFLNRIGVATTRFAEIASADDLRRAMAEIGLPAILKTARLGYDGKGQRTVRAGCDPEAEWRALGAGRAILEARVDFEREVSVVLARGADGAIAAFDTVENRHENGILRTSRVPARIPSEVHEEARSVAARIAAALDFRRRAGGRVLPRPGRRRPGQRDRAPGAQLGPLDPRRLRRQPVRAGGARGLLAPFGGSRASLRRGDDQPARRRGRGLAAHPRRAGGAPPPLRQGGSAPRTQDGARHPAVAARRQCFT